MAMLASPVAGQDVTADAPSPEAAQSLMISAIGDWGRISSDRLDVHYKVTGVTAQPGNCATLIRYDAGSTIVIDWTKAGAISFRDLKTSGYPYLVKIRRPPAGYVQLYFSSDDVARRALSAAEFLKAFCDPLGGRFQ